MNHTFQKQGVVDGGQEKVRTKKSQEIQKDKDIGAWKINPHHTKKGTLSINHRNHMEKFSSIFGHIIHINNASSNIGGALCLQDASYAY